MKIRVNSPREPSGYKWLDVKKGQTIELKRFFGLSKGLTPVEEKKELEIKPEPKKTHKVELKEKPVKAQKEDFDFKKELMNIKGIGKKTAEDIMKVYPTLANLNDSMGLNEDLPFRDDIVDKLIEKYGK